MITVKLGDGNFANLHGETVEAVRKGKKKGESVIRIGTMELAILEEAGALAKRIKDDGGLLEKAEKVEEDAPPGGEEPPPPADEEFLPPGGEGSGGMST